MPRRYNQMQVLILDNYDSFTYNLVQYVHDELGTAPDVYRNDKIPVEEAERYDKILLSPGPGLPVESGILMSLIQRYASKKDILGVCLGHQAIAEAFGGNLFNMAEVMHGVATNTVLTTQIDSLFNGMPTSFKAGRYHSWSVSRDGFPAELEVTAVDDLGNIMALKHRTLKVRGVQFHPESVLTEHGRLMIKNWLAA